MTLLYPPQQTNPEWDCKPEGSLAYPSLGAALEEAGFGVKVFDACVGNEKDSLDVFNSSSPLPSGLKRTGVAVERILEEVKDSDIVGITSILTNQETMALEAARLIKSHFPEKLLISGGTNARSRYDVFLDAGFDLVCMSEAERAIVSIAEEVARRGQQWGRISAVAFREGGKFFLAVVAGLEEGYETVVKMFPNPLRTLDLRPTTSVTLTGIRSRGSALVVRFPAGATATEATG